MRLVKDGKTIASRVDVPSTFVGRAAGLLGRGDIPAGYAMFFRNCNSIHTFFMKIPIDVIMTDSKGSVVYCATVKPWRVAACLRAGDTFEMMAGSIEKLGIVSGDKVELQKERTKDRQPETEV
ncbi:MAG: DUF192 domain-containing protein [Spirochaetia bacterium]|nr:DUF192 domain-containing protein [Spirochaetia bacterium]